jgi:uncharacterized membrane protein
MALIDRYFAQSDLRKISEACKQAEQNTAGEVRVSIFSKRPRKLRNLNLGEFALAEFQHLGMEKTRDRTGILLLIILAEKKFQILADAGIHQKVEQGTWDTVAAGLSDYFKKGDYLTGIIDNIRQMADVLERHFPKKSDDTDELSNEVIVHQ